MRTRLLMLITGVALVASATCTEAMDATATPRWSASPVCPLVSGLSREEGEFILTRVSEIARGAGAPLAAEDCSPNLYILVTADPKDLLREMEKRNRAFTFGADASRGAVDAFISTPRAVRVWYNTFTASAWGTPLNHAHPYAINDFPALTIPSGAFSNLVPRVAYRFSRVFVVVDGRQLQEVSRGQLADYVGMVGLAQLGPGARRPGGDSILNLFDHARQGAPAGMSDSDRAFLKSLYANNGSH
jgi:hypothetical protein